MDVNETSETAGIQFPIEGETHWNKVMRVLALGTVGALIAIGAVFQFFQQDSEAESSQLGLVMMGLIALLVFEYILFLKVIVPRTANYGRFRLHENAVEFFPLSGMGLSVSTQANKVRIGKFLGLTVRKSRDNKNSFAYNVYLIHPEKGYTVNVKTFDQPQAAHDFAQALGRTLDLQVAAGNSNKHRREEPGEAA